MPANGLEHIRTLREAGVLQDSGTQKLDLRKGVILVHCADGDQVHDKYTHMVKAFEALGIAPRTHILSLNGGALRIPANSPLNAKVQHHHVYMENIVEARTLKGIDSIQLGVHYPCGAATLAGLSVIDCLMLLHQARMDVLGLNHGVTVVCTLHVDYGDNRKRTYQICLDRLATWFEENYETTMDEGLAEVARTDVRGS